MVEEKNDYLDDFEEEEDSGSDLDFVVNRAYNPRNLKNADELSEDFGCKTKTRQELEEDDLFAMEEADDGVQFMAVKPYLGAVQESAPTNPPPIDPSSPEEDLAVEWVYGYRGYDARSNICYSSKKEFIYPAAAVVVCYDVKNHSQRHYQGHNDDVVCLAQHPLDPDIIATGQVATVVDGRATNPHICVYNWKTGEEWIIKNAHKRAVHAIGFSADGKYLATVGDDNKHEVTVWDWQSKSKVASQKGDTNSIYHLRWNHQNPTEFVTVGKRHVYFWEFSGGALQKKRGLLGKFDMQTFTCVGFSSKGYACVGCKDGSVYIFVDGKAKKSFKVHDKSVFSVDWYQEGLVTGGKDGQVVVLDKRVKPIQQIAVPGRVMAVHISGDDLIIGTNQGSIYQVDNFASGDVNLTEPTVSAHFDGELWGLALSPNGAEFATVGEDNLLIVWDIDTHKAVRQAVINEKKGKRLKGGSKASTSSSLPPNQCARAIDWSHDGKMIAIGTNSGELIVFNAKNLSVLKRLDLNSHGKRQVLSQKENWIQALKWSQNDSIIAVGSHGNVICLVDVKANFTVGGVLSAHNAAVTHLDWNKDGTALQTNCRAYELLYHDVDCKQLKNSKQNKKPSAFRETQWSTQTCILNWGVIGVFDAHMDGTDVNCVHRSPLNGRLLASGDDFGYVNLYRFPVIDSSHEKKKKAGHSSHVMSVLFTADEKRLLTAGGADKTVIQWQVV